MGPFGQISNMTLRMGKEQSYKIKGFFLCFFQGVKYRQYTIHSREIRGF